MDTSGRVIGVIDGGIESGAGSVSWAIPVTQVDALFSQPEYEPDESELATAAKRSALLYSADLRADEGPEVALEVNGYRLVKRRTRMLAEMQQTTEDQRGLQQILSTIASAGVPLASLRFDIYEHSQSGACVVLPQDLRLEDKGGILAGAADRGRFQLLVRLQTVHDDPEKYSVGLQFENYISGLDPGSYWQADSNWTYSTPQRRFDGALVMRKGAMGGMPYGGYRYAFETLAARNGTEIQVGALNNYLNPQQMRPDEIRDWAALVLSVHLSQFSQ